jgi:hypothetical protein
VKRSKKKKIIIQEIVLPSAQSSPASTSHASRSTQCPTASQKLPHFDSTSVQTQDHGSATDELASIGHKIEDLMK